MQHSKAQKYAPKPAAKRLKTYLGGMFCALILAGCQGLDLAQAPVAAVQLSGVWTVDEEASDDLRVFTRPPSERRRPKLSVQEEIRGI